jgi:RimJ/RimL family protein N-acetyltransferase
MNFNSSYILQHKSNKEYKFVPALFIHPDKDFLSHIAKVCNEELIYNRLFRKACDNQEYPIEKAVGFIDWAKAGFENSSHFVFLLVSAENNPVGAIDIKGNDLESSEIGYWLSNHHSGLMTNAVIELTRQAKLNGFKSLFGMCEIDNMKSQAVLNRAGFENQGQITRNSKEYWKYAITLK